MTNYFVIVKFILLFGFNSSNRKVPRKIAWASIIRPNSKIIIIPCHYYRRFSKIVDIRFQCITYSESLRAASEIYFLTFINIGYFLTSSNINSAIRAVYYIKRSNWRIDKDLWIFTWYQSQISIFAMNFFLNWYYKTESLQTNKFCIIDIWYIGQWC